jgi:hypothetical protein
LTCFRRCGQLSIWCIDSQAWVTLGRAQLNFGEPDKAIESFDRALAIKVRALFHYAKRKFDAEHGSSHLPFLLGLFVGSYRQPDYSEAKADRDTSSRLVKKTRTIALFGRSEC